MIEGESVGINGIQFQNTFVPVTSSINVPQTQHIYQTTSPLNHQVHQIHQVGAPTSHSKLYNTMHRLGTQGNVQIPHAQPTIIQAQPINSTQPRIIPTYPHQVNQIHQTQTV